NTGQNAIAQARMFSEATPLSGLILTKLDGTAKGGAVLAIASELKIPVRFIGLGEAAEDLVPFDADSFLEAVLGTA
ncbi:MAG: signal recognition particle-docking protein FtsY, partial [Bdellovibrionales bacterium]|nr:signal recognition particle-docking protein FtsY [Bdellovibrionales bacterium]